MISDTNSHPSGGGDFFALAARRLDYIDQRQRVLAQNIANANTPNYQARDLSPFEARRASRIVDPSAHVRTRAGWQYGQR